MRVITVSRSARQAIIAIPLTSSSDRCGKSPDGCVAAKTRKKWPGPCRGVRNPAVTEDRRERRGHAPSRRSCAVTTAAAPGALDPEHQVARNLLGLDHLAPRQDPDDPHVHHQVDQADRRPSRSGSTGGACGAGRPPRHRGSRSGSSRGNRTSRSPAPYPDRGTTGDRRSRPTRGSRMPGPRRNGSAPVDDHPGHRDQHPRPEDDHEPARPRRSVDRPGT